MHSVEKYLTCTMSLSAYLPRDDRRTVSPSSSSIAAFSWKETKTMPWNLFKSERGLKLLNFYCPKYWLSAWETPERYSFAIRTSPIIQLVFLPPTPPPKFCITFVFNFSWVLQSSHEKLKTMLKQNLERTNEVYYGRCAKTNTNKQLKARVTLFTDSPFSHRP